jgi:hypothetical protein
MVDSNRGKLIAIDAWKGEARTIGFRNMQDLRVEIEKEIGIPERNQLLLNADGGEFRYEEEKGNAKVFAFNREYFQDFAPEIKSIDPPDNDFPKEDLSLISSENASDKIKSQLEMNVRLCGWYYQRQDKAFGSAELCLESITNRIQGTILLMKNLNVHSKIGDQQFKLFLEKYNSKRNEWQSYITALEENLKKIRETDLHPGFKNTNHQVLSDIIPKEFEKSKLKCLNLIAEVDKKIEIMRNDNPDLRSNIEKSSKFEVDISKSVSVQELKESKDAIKLVSQKLYLIYEEFAVKYSEADSLQSDIKSEEVRDWENTKKNQEMMLIDIRTESDGLNSEILKFVSAQENLSELIQDAFFLYGKAARHLKRFQKFESIYTEVIKKVDEKNFPILAISKLVHSQHLALNEIRRRRVFFKKFQSAIEKFSAEMANMRNFEIEERRKFLREHGKYVPVSLVDFNSRPPVLQLNIQSFEPTWDEFEDKECERILSQNIAFLEPFGGSRESAKVGNEMKEDFPKANLHDDEVRKLKSELEILKKEIITLNNEKQKLNSANYDASKLAKDIESMKEDLRNSRAEIMYLQNKADSLIQHGYFEYNDLVMFLKSGENYMPITRSPVTYSLSIENIETIRKSKYW